jgi:uncharacterized membrane protein
MNRLRTYFIAGLLVILPLFLTLAILAFVFRFVDGILGNIVNSYVRRTLGFYIPGIGIVLFVSLVLLTGILSTHFFGRFLNRLIDRVMERFPLLRHIYPSLKQIFRFIFSKEQMAFKRTVLLEYPCKGCWSLGFITNEGFREAKERTAQDLLNVFIPLAPNPASGFYVLAPRKDVIILDMEIKDAITLIFSGGVLNPEDIPRKKGA